MLYLFCYFFFSWWWWWIWNEKYFQKWLFHNNTINYGFKVRQFVYYSSHFRIVFLMEEKKTAQKTSATEQANSASVAETNALLITRPCAKQSLKSIIQYFSVCRVTSNFKNNWPRLASVSHTQVPSRQFGEFEWT